MTIVEITGGMLRAVRPRQGQRGAISIGGGRCRMRLRRFGKHRETKMGWQDLTHSDENAKYHCYRFARLVSDDTSQELGLVMQFYEWGPAALLDDCRLGPHDTFEEAQAAVEDPKKAKPLAYFSTSKLDDVSRGPLGAPATAASPMAGRAYSRRQLLANAAIAASP